MDGNLALGWWLHNGIYIDIRLVNLTRLLEQLM